ncbi:phosphoglycerate kinase [Poseidonibacter ostreae]|jgi:phosphoglycerate kinase|uniref:Phosphoglycerate kinase n=1 Tax=Poseidonibacter ostreae TaxID=2654171 RepID=A0A6L4WTE9_9BACT|nr:phosphoglycerate kinase [Poseidonibacter ostreae]KAB7886011.1 phosphoglycerate kinase [Poseidonibacter ostreae]KAB7889463.1 phosphoglycerate kinase [Poseidonibacter ostreae]KAB7892522.1 phosphoglycerate kinase [Poseidonibacter ostreae]MAC83581.1 phosphoglycerate kinase [Arcobacter sp.]|tara:strand:+ start:1652 stop:2851 length:1200 start_codon:yes stop_codon:yes gene_type:complete
MKLQELKNIDIAGKRVFIRCDFNVPMDEYNNITDDRRIRSALNTIRYCVDNDCSIILASHFGRPKKKFDPDFSLKPVAKRLHTLLKQEIKMAEHIVREETIEIAKNLKPGEILLLENLRYNDGEKNNDPEFAAKLASMADVFVNDAFGVSHRAHASVEGIAKHFDVNSKAAGFLLAKEIKFFHHIVHEPKRPFVSIVGGSKVSGKLEALYNLVPKVDKIIIGGGMAFTFLKALGHEVGNSLVEEDLIPEAIRIMDEAKKLGVKLYLPVDVVAAEAFDAEAIAKHVTVQEIPKNWMGLDIGPASAQLFSLALRDANTILWNGPMGVYEMDKFAKGSTKVSHAVASSFATTVVGGGDTADLVRVTGDEDEMTFISTGGGASLELIEGKILPGVKALVIEED